MAIQSGFGGGSYSYGGRSVPKPKIPEAKPLSGGSTASAGTGAETPDIKMTEPKDQEPAQDAISHEASSVSNNDTMQDVVLRGNTQAKSSSGRKPPSVRKKVSKSVIQIRDFPRDVMDIVRGVVPGGNSYVETLLAYIYVTSPTKFDIPPNVQEIVDSYETDDPQSRILNEIRLLREQLKNLETSVYQGTIAGECTLMSLLGFFQSTATHPSDVNYTSPGVEDMHIALEGSAKEMKKKDAIRRGVR